ncbi:unnamed protein product [Caenorhabditis nigoni]|uniref:Uncharacterized protein n=1 Tax=Caenorhabditis nigoni TaxID=1611254 RepID=A0A2G5SV28_9PELO|nr:hypothetical protein B9Z55_024679 [Caenorhabditis nigoni]
MDWFTVLGVSGFIVVLMVLSVISSRFLWLAFITNYMPCRYNYFRGEYRKFIMSGTVHTALICTFSIIQLVMLKYSMSISCFLWGSLHTLFLVPSIFYYHLLVINYKFRDLETHYERQPKDYEKSLVVDALSVILYFIIAIYSFLLFNAEVYYPYGMYTYPNYDPATYFHYDTFLTSLRVIQIFSISMLVIDFFRILKHTYRVYRSDLCYNDNDPIDTFSRSINKQILLHVLHDVPLIVPLVYMVVRAHPVLRPNVFDIIAKVWVCIHPILYTLIYMYQIHRPTLTTSPEAMQCKCWKCRPKLDGTNRPICHWITEWCCQNNQKEEAREEERRWIELGERGEGEGAVAAAAEAEATTTGDETANEQEQPTETTPALHTTEIDV